MKRLLVCAGTALLAGCLAGPDYRRPPVDPPATFQYAAKDAADTADTR